MTILIPTSIRKMKKYNFVKKYEVFYFSSIDIFENVFEIVVPFQNDNSLELGQLPKIFFNKKILQKEIAFFSRCIFGRFEDLKCEISIWNNILSIDEVKKKSNVTTLYAAFDSEAEYLKWKLKHAV